MSGPKGLCIGVIADTHNVLRPEALGCLRDVHHIIHAGDICRAEILEELARLAPVSAVRGNHDRGAFAASMPDALTLTLAGRRIHVVHALRDLKLNPWKSGVFGD